MKLIFKIFKKVRDLKEEKIKLEKKIQDAWEEFHQERTVFVHKLRDREAVIEYREDRLQCREEECGYKSRLILYDKEELEKREDDLDQREKELDQREEELNEMQRKLNDQILKLGIVNGVNN